MAAFAASPWKGHLEAVYHIFAYLKQHDRSRLVFDASRPNNVEQSLPDWTDFYKDVCWIKTQRTAPVDDCTVEK